LPIAQLLIADLLHPEWTTSIQIGRQKSRIGNWLLSKAITRDNPESATEQLAVGHSRSRIGNSQAAVESRICNQQLAAISFFPSLPFPLIPLSFGPFQIR